MAADDDPGGIRFSNVSHSAEFCSVLRYNANWRAASDYERESFKEKNPVNREPGGGYSGSWTQQRAYSSGGRGLLRSGI